MIKNKLKIPVFLREPYKIYKSNITKQKLNGSLLEIDQALEIIQYFIKTNMSVIASDIPSSLKALSKGTKIFENKVSKYGKKIPFKDAS